TEITDLNTVSPGIAEIATEAGCQSQFVLVDQLLSHFLDLFLVTNHEAEVLRAIRLQCVYFKDRHELVFTQLAPSGAFTASEHLQAEDIGIELHRFLGVGDLNDDMITPVDLDGHHAPSFLSSRMLKKSASIVLASLRGSTYRSVRLASSLAA